MSKKHKRIQVLEEMPPRKIRDLVVQIGDVLDEARPIEGRSIFRKGEAIEAIGRRFAAAGLLALVLAVSGCGGLVYSPATEPDLGVLAGLGIDLSKDSCALAVDGASGLEQRAGLCFLYAAGEQGGAVKAGDVTISVWTPGPGEWTLPAEGVYLTLASPAGACVGGAWRGAARATSGDGRWGAVFDASCEARGLRLRGAIGGAVR